MYHENLKNNGVHLFGEILAKNKIDNLYQKMLASRKFDSSIFLSHEEYLAKKNHLKANPSQKFNFLNQFSNDLDFIEHDAKINKVVVDMLGEDYEIVIKKAICGVPNSWLPEWIKAKISDINVANLGAYIKKSHQDITYFRGIDFHQDIIDWPKGATKLNPSHFLTMYVYLHDVGVYDSPLHIMPKSHQLGATLFPHKLEKIADDVWKYSDDSGDTITCQDKILTGKSGYVGIWHNCTLHGTQPILHESEKFRLSLRYLIGKSNKNKKNTYINTINNTLKGNGHEPLKTRVDLNKKGEAVMTGNIINK